MRDKCRIQGKKFEDWTRLQQVCFNEYMKYYYGPSGTYTREDINAMTLILADMVILTQEDSCNDKK